METGEHWRQASESNTIEIEVKLTRGEKGNNNKREYNKCLQAMDVMDGERDKSCAP